jgi:hypothetical protein
MSDQDALERRRAQSRERVARFRARKREEKTDAEIPIGRVRAVDLIESADRDLISRYLTVRGTRLLQASRDAYQTDLAELLLIAVLVPCSLLLFLRFLSGLLSGFVIRRIQMIDVRGLVVRREENCQHFKGSIVGQCVRVW